MKKIALLTLLALVLIRCGKDDTPVVMHNDTIVTIPPVYIVAGDSVHGTFYPFLYSIANLDDGDSVPSGLSSSSSAYANLSISIDTAKDFEIRYGVQNFLVNNYLINRGLFLSNEYGNDKKIEFALTDTIYGGIGHDTIKMLCLFSPGDTINKKQRWISTINPEPHNNVYFLSYYYDFEYDNILRFPPDSEPLQGSNVFIHKTIKETYVGIRKKQNDTYIYGWIKCSLENFENLRLTGCTFADKGK